MLFCDQRTASHLSSVESNLSNFYATTRREPSCLDTAYMGRFPFLPSSISPGCIFENSRFASLASLLTRLLHCANFARKFRTYSLYNCDVTAIKYWSISKCIVVKSTQRLCNTRRKVQIPPIKVHRAITAAFSELFRRKWAKIEPWTPYITCVCEMQYFDFRKADGGSLACASRPPRPRISKVSPEDSRSCRDLKSKVVWKYQFCPMKCISNWISSGWMSFGSEIRSVIDETESEVAESLNIFVSHLIIKCKASLRKKWT